MEAVFQTEKKMSYKAAIGWYAVYLVASFWLAVFGILSWAWFMIGLTPLLIVLALGLLDWFGTPGKRKML